MKKILNPIFSLICISIIFLFSGCLKNDIPYPTITVAFTQMDANGLKTPAVIDDQNQTVTLTFEEKTDLSNVQLENVKLNEPRATSSVDFKKPVDLSQPLKVTLSLYQDYIWTIIPLQPIERIFKIKNPMGDPVFDVENKIAYAYTTPEADLADIDVLELKLGPIDITTMDVNISELHDFTKEQKVTIKYHDITETWTLIVEKRIANVETGAVYPWVNVAWLNGMAKIGADNGFEWKLASGNDWKKVDKSFVTENNGVITTRLTGLKAEMSYTVRAYSDNEYGHEVSFTTGVAIPLNNGSFDNWNKSGKVWNPWAVDATPFWDTGNKGATTIGDSNTFPVEGNETSTGTGMAASLNSRFIGIPGFIGKFAAGNLFVGEFVGLDGMNGILNFGKPFNSFPTKLKIHYKYTTGAIDYASSEFTSIKGQPDTCAIYIALIDSDQPIEIRTNPKNPSYFDKNASYVIAYAELNLGKNNESYVEQILELDYRALNRTPKYLIIVCTASKYGDYFTGSTKAKLLVDNFELLYDY